MADICVLAFFGLARLRRLGGKAALQNLHPRFFIRADDETAFLVEAQQFPLTVGSSYTSDVGTCLAGSLNEPIC